MNKKLFIIIGVAIIIVLVLTWAYLLIFGAPKSVSDVFTDLGDNNGETLERPVVTEEEYVQEDPTSTINLERPKLRQLTTKQVAGYQEIPVADNSDLIFPTLYYAEQGTGHIYSIDLNTGEEKRISGTTVAKTNRAKISPDGKHAAFTSVSNTKVSPLTIGDLNDHSDLVIRDFEENVTDFALGGDEEVLYSTLEADGLKGYAYSLVTGESKEIFALPFFEANIIWGKRSTDSHYLYPKTTYGLEGYLYEVKNGVLKRLPVSGFGFSANVNADFVIYTALEKTTPRGFIYNRATEENTKLPGMIIPDKCFIPETGYSLLCAQEPLTVAFDYLDSWYKGKISFKDSLWEMSASALTADLLIDTFTESGRELDIIDLAVGPSRTAAYFINKNDNTLWMYEF